MFMVGKSSYSAHTPTLPSRVDPQPPVAIEMRSLAGQVSVAHARRYSVLDAAGPSDGAHRIDIPPAPDGDHDELDPSFDRHSTDLDGDPEAVIPRRVSGEASACAVSRETIIQLLKASVSQAAATGATFGLRPFHQALTKELMVLCGLGSSPFAPFIVAAIDGPFVGVIHTVVGRAVAAGMNHLLQADTYKLKSGHDPFWEEVKTIDLPVMVSFGLAYAAKGDVMGATPTIGQDAIAKAIASIAGGFVQGAITEALKRSRPDVYERVPAQPNGKTTWEVTRDRFVAELDKLVTAEGAIGHDLWGKMLGSGTGDMAVAGIVSALKLHHVEVSPGLLSGIAMTAYLTGWFGAIHATDEWDGWLRNNVFPEPSSPPPAPPPASPMLELATMPAVEAGPPAPAPATLCTDTATLIEGMADSDSDREFV